ncbi:methyltransferase domain-containing protein [Brucella anthropi]|uniref:methyltransferase domain-containing protein n=1 Tax=Brucella anthropi TaxID=529 RepID=UPI000F665091|nr:methyltransferase domain-containing protein [Brucella anthropi]RRY08815.1 methyltransferase domain-containing protein [Brucella anthropi]
MSSNSHGKSFDIPENWTFKTPEVAAAFDSHVREQLPWYDIATGIVAHVARHYVPENGTVIDVGASTGNVGRAISKTLSDRQARLIAIDNAADMAERYQAPGEMIVSDVLAFDFQPYKPDLIVAFLALMFVPVANRAGVVRQMVNAIQPGGAVLVFDKMAARAGHIGSVIYRLTLAAKYENGAPADEIIQKELSLAGVQRPMTEAELPGFDPIFRFGDFAGFIYERPAI